MPKSSLKLQEFNQKKPYILATVFSIIIVIFAYGFLQEKIVDVKRRALEELKVSLQPLNANKIKLDEQLKIVKERYDDAEFARVWLQERFLWREILPTLRECLMETEKVAKTELDEADTGVWIEEMYTEKGGVVQEGGVPAVGADPAAAAAAAAPPTDRGMRTRSLSGQTGAATNIAPATVITHLVLKVRSLDMTSVKPEGNTTVAFELLKQLQARTNLFDTNGVDATAFKGNITTESNTFTTEISVKLKNPITL